MDKLKIYYVDEDAVLRLRAISERLKNRSDRERDEGQQMEYLVGEIEKYQVEEVSVLQRIVRELDGTTWSADTCNAIAQHLRDAGYSARDVQAESHLVVGQCAQCFGINRHERNCPTGKGAFSDHHLD